MVVNKEDILHEISDNLDKAISSINQITLEYRADKPQIFTQLKNHNDRISKLEALAGIERGNYDRN